MVLKYKIKINYQENNMTDIIMTTRMSNFIALMMWAVDSEVWITYQIENSWKKFNYLIMEHYKICILEMQMVGLYRNVCIENDVN